MASFGEIFKVFLEKHLIPTVTAVAMSILSLLLIPDDNPAKNRLGTTLFLILVFCVSFLTVQLILLIGKSIRSVVVNENNRQFNQEYTEKQNRETLEDLWNIVDAFCTEDYLMLMEFVTHENRPISKSCSYSYGRLLSSEYVNSTDIMEPIKAYRQNTKQYCLIDNFYNALKYSYEKYGKISHFKK